jgi:hypothetical protein
MYDGRHPCQKRPGVALTALSLLRTLPMTSTGLSTELIR